MAKPSSYVIGAAAVMMIAAGVHGSSSAAASSTPAAGAHGSGAVAALESLLGSIHMPSSGSAAAAIRFAAAQEGKPYCWGGAGPSCYDCSGLVMEAWRAGGLINAAANDHSGYTTATMWDSLPHVPAGQVRPGDAVLMVGGDGSPASPGHVGLVINPATQTMVEAYAAGFPVRVSTYGAGHPQGDVVVGFVRPPGLGG